MKLALGLYGLCLLLVAIKGANLSTPMKIGLLVMVAVAVYLVFQ